jgi:hypothetical protein
LKKVLDKPERLGFALSRQQRQPTKTTTNMTTTSAQTNISGYSIEFENDGETTQCWIINGNASASLEALLMTGCLTDHFGDDVRVPKAIINRIEAWARSKGY